MGEDSKAESVQPEPQQRYHNGTYIHEGSSSNNIGIGIIGKDSSAQSGARFRGTERKGIHGVQANGEGRQKGAEVRGPTIANTRSKPNTHLEGSIRRKELCSVSFSPSWVKRAHETT